MKFLSKVGLKTKKVPLLTKKSNSKIIIKDPFRDPFSVAYWSSLLTRHAPNVVVRLSGCVRSMKTLPCRVEENIYRSSQELVWFTKYEIIK